MEQFRKERIFRENLDEFDDSYRVVQSLIEEYKAAEGPDYTQVPQLPVSSLPFGSMAETASVSLSTSTSPLPIFFLLFFSVGRARSGDSSIRRRGVKDTILRLRHFSFAARSTSRGAGAQ